VELMASGNDALFGYFLSLGQKVTRRLRRRNSGACQERHRHSAQKKFRRLRRRNSGACQAQHRNPNHKTPHPATPAKPAAPAKRN
ncbi:hypothetical protein, partial [Cupriavidus numazuensis]|uniref:hypothetical protein n=1 Tax=Cupriavidus numazuensis TaxID=221992 RepID=UPI001BAAD340